MEYMQLAKCFVKTKQAVVDLSKDKNPIVIIKLLG